MLSVFSMLATVFSCNEDVEVGPPSIDYIRYTTAGDTVTYANLGQTIAIIGENLETVKEITFNGYPANFKTTMVTNTSVVAYVSKDTPFQGDEANNKVMLVTDGGEASFDFEIAPPAPEVDAVSPEYAGAGAMVNIKGSYFYNISEVYFGEDQAKILDISPNMISVEVPDDYSKSKITVISSKSGEGKSDFMFGLDEGVVQLNWADIQPANGAWWNSSADGPVDDFSALGIPYKYVEGTFGSTWWTLDGGINFSSNEYRKGNPATKVFKFEYALIGDSPWIQFLWKSSLGEHKYILEGLAPTNGEWATYSIPMTSFKLGDGGPDMTQAAFEGDDPLLFQYAFVNSGNAEITIKCAMTNFRIVDK